MNPDWLVPQWPVPPQVRALCTSRVGGVSVAPFATFNLGDHVGDIASAVAVNRALLEQALCAHPVFLSQVHGTQLVALTDQTLDGTPGDASFTDQRHLACTMLVADCLPVLFSNAAGTRVAAAHAGWRGLVGQGGQGVLEETLACFKPPDVIVWLGPCIGPEAFEVGDEVRDQFVTHDPAAQAFFVPRCGQKWLADLPGLARLRLAARGVTQVYGNDGSRDWCTVQQSSRFFSYRRDGVTGRLAASVWLR
ncbi:MAG: YfiH family protein [Rhodoferax sp.]